MEETHIQDIGQGKSYPSEIYFHLNFACVSKLCIKVAS